MENYQNAKFTDNNQPGGSEKYRSPILTEDSHHIDQQGIGWGLTMFCLIKKIIIGMQKSGYHQGVV